MALAVSAILLLMANAAKAATVSVIDGTITYTANPSEANGLTLDFQRQEVGGVTRYTVMFDDAGATVEPGPGCVQVNLGSACEDTAVGRPLRLSLGDRGDRLALDDCAGEQRPISVWTSRGEDSVRIGACSGAVVTVFSGAHDDRVETRLNSSRGSTLYGGHGNDALVVAEGGWAFLYGGEGHDELTYDSTIYDEDNPTAWVDVHGGSGRDTIRPAFYDSFDSRTISGESGIDTLSFAMIDEPMFFDMAACAACDIEGVIGTSDGDTIFGDDDTNWIWSGGGDDTIEPRGGLDYVYSGAGDDTVTSIDGTWDTIRCGDGLLDTVSADRRESIGECEIVHREAG